MENYIKNNLIIFCLQNRITSRKSNLVSQTAPFKQEPSRLSQIHIWTATHDIAAASAVDATAAAAVVEVVVVVFYSSKINNNQ